MARYRFEGNTVRTLDAKPFRHADLSPRQELSEAKGELARLERWRVENTTWKTWPASDTPEMKRIEALQRKVRGLELFFDSAWKPAAVETLSDLNRANAAYYRENPNG